MKPTAVMSHSQPRLAYIFDDDGHPRSPRRASALHGEAPCSCHFSGLYTTSSYVYFVSLRFDTASTGLLQNLVRILSIFDV